jgi:hypothetical protein
MASCSAAYVEVVISTGRLGFGAEAAGERRVVVGQELCELQRRSPLKLLQDVHLPVIAPIAGHLSERWPLGVN